MCLFNLTVFLSFFKKNFLLLYDFMVKVNEPVEGCLALNHDIPYSAWVCQVVIPAAEMENDEKALPVVFLCDIGKVSSCFETVFRMLVTT